MKEANFLKIDQIGTSVYILDSFSVYRFNFMEMKLELFYELSDKSLGNSFTTLKVD